MTELDDRRQTIFETMNRILTQINNTYSTFGVELPTKQFFDLGGQGETPHDCEQVSVSFEQMYNGAVGNPDQTPTGCYAPRTATFVIEVVRCTPTLKRPTGRGGALIPPSVEELSEAVEIQTNDAWLLMDAGLTMAEEFSLAGGLADVLVSPESGGYQAVILNLVLSLQ